MKPMPKAMNACSVWAPPSEWRNTAWPMYIAKNA